MLTPAQVIPFLEHEDENIRAHAVRYLAYAHDPAPATAEDFWRAIDKFGLTDWSLSANLSLLPQTEQSYGRLTTALRALDQANTEEDELVTEHLWDALEALDSELLLKHRDEVLGFDKAPDRVRRALEERLALQNVPLDELWDRLLKRSELLEEEYEDDEYEDDEYEDDEYDEEDDYREEVEEEDAGGEDEDESEDEEEDEDDEDELDEDALDEDEEDEAEESEDEDDEEDENDEEEDDEEEPRQPSSRYLIEALARDFPREAAARAMDRLTNGPRDDGMEVYCVKLVGETKHREAVPLLLKRLRSDSDELMEAVAKALVQLGNADVVRQIEAFYPGKSPYVRFTLQELLGRIKVPDSEAVLARLLREKVRHRWYRPQGSELEAFTGIASELLELCPSAESLELVRQILLDRRYNAHVEALDEELLVVGSMVGYEPPEAETWRKAIADRDAARAREEALYNEMFKPPGGTGKVFTNLLGNIADRTDQAEVAKPDEPIRPPESPDPLTPIRRRSPKVGRNDPCPCGSGKKYKKCCMRGDEAG